MNLKTLFSVAAFSLATVLQAGVLTPDEALGRLSQLPMRQHLRAHSRPVLRMTVDDPSGLPALYIFSYSGEDGFLLLSAEDAAAPLLGYSDANPFATENLPCNLGAWLSYYSDMIFQARQSGASASWAAASSGTRAGEKAAVGPLLSTAWNQTAPFNNQCPRVGNHRCVTGCVATAMAQVMNYWKYPVQGQGQLTYSPESIAEDLFIDFSETVFDWDNMLDVYGRSYTNKEANAVALLMKACGYSVRMNYSPGESGAYSRDIASALTTYFGYDKGTSRKERNNYDSQDAWTDMIYRELTTTGPVIYDGVSSGGAHCFVCDGYDGNGYFHINWGWGGMSDGYFLLNELTPGEVGTGGHYGGYNISQDAITGIMPPVGRVRVDDIIITNAASDSGNVRGWGYTYRINNFSDVCLSVDLTIGGGHVTSPLYVTVYDTDLTKLSNIGTLLDLKFDRAINASDGPAHFSTSLSIEPYDPSKLYTIDVAYELKGQKTTIGNLRLAASSGIDDVIADDSLAALELNGRILSAATDRQMSITVYSAAGTAVAHGENSVSLETLPAGIYIARASGAEGQTSTLKLLLK